MDLFQRLPDKTPVSFELFIFKWMFLPALALGLFLVFLKVSEGRKKCENICLEKEFSDFRYVPSGRYGIGGNECYCLTEEESTTKNRIPQGVRVF